ncbi:unnamed protein product, partial [Phaeothamnion confervicola]
QSYLYNLKNSLEDEDKGLAGKLGEADKEELASTIAEAIDWLDENAEAQLDDLKHKQKEVEQVASPIMKSFYQSQGSAAGGGYEDYRFGDDEL